MRISSSLSLRLGALVALLAGSSIPALAQMGSGQMDAYQGAIGQDDAGQPQTRYGYYRIVDGNASVQSQDGNAPLEANQPLVPGDRLSTGAGSRVEVVLPDGALLRVGDNTRLSFDQLAVDGDGSTTLVLDNGEVQVVAGGDDDTRIDTDAATVYVRGAGAYRIEQREGATHVAVRSGQAEVRTPRGARMLDDGQDAWVDTDGGVQMVAAAPADTLERWASTLDDQYRRTRSDNGYVDTSLSYASYNMAGYGSWVTYEGRSCWRPRVGADWSPYRYGRWMHTPVGLTWLSSEPWGWVPYHYGSWDYVPGWGWVWYPGHTWAPAWVYWYWGPSYTGWCPIGYYSHYYGPRFGFGIDLGFRFGVYGWAGGRRWDRWNFVDCHRLWDHRLARYTRDWHHLGVRELPRGVIATDTRAIRRDFATHPDRAIRALVEHSPGREGFAKPIRRELPDISRFIARDPHADRSVVRGVLPVRDHATPGEIARGRNGRSESIGGTGARSRGFDGRTDGRVDLSRGRGAQERSDWRNDRTRPELERPRSGDSGRARAGSQPDWRGRAVTPGSDRHGNVEIRHWRDADGPAGAAREGVDRGRDQSWRGQSGRDQVGRDQVGRDRVGRDQAGRDQGWRGTPGDARPPVRRIIEGTRSNRPEAASYGSPYGSGREPSRGSAPGGSPGYYGRPYGGGSSGGAQPRYEPRHDSGGGRGDGGGYARSGGSAHERSSGGGGHHDSGGHASHGHGRPPR